MVLKQKKCRPCRKGDPNLTHGDIDTLSQEICGWKVIEQHHLQKFFKFKNFTIALDYVNRVGKVAEAEGHHPDICFGWGRVEIKIYTHTINGLHENDFILAAKIDELKIER